MQHIASTRAYGRSIALVENNGEGDLASLSAEHVTGLLRRWAAVLYRGFRPNIESFSAWVQRHGGRLSLDPARRFEAPGVQHVDSGLAAIPLHIENGVAPTQPDLLWFYCEHAAASGSQTTVCDGVRVWAELSDAARDFFRSAGIKYARTFEPAHWRPYMAHELGPNVTPDSVTHEHVRALFAKLPGQVAEPRDGDRLYTEFTVPAVRLSALCPELAFANSLIGPSYNYAPPRITTHDDRPIPEALLTEVRAVTEACTEQIDWRDGDVLLIDNHRAMHGRRRIEDPARRIFAALSYRDHA
jgi:alpha-ketoglutarate-dependent taurine dioxygenase